MIKQKKGEMTITQTLTTILLILGFAIMLFVFYRVYQSLSIDRETCYQSIVLRATAGYLSPNIAAGVAKEAIPLKCRTEKVCITSGLFGGKCKEFEGEKGITTIKVKDINQLQKIYAEQILNCWTMTGEGKVDLFSGYMTKLSFEKIYPSCIICSRVALDIEGLSKAGINASKIDLDKYLSTHLVPEKKVTYLNYIGGENGKISVENIVLPNSSLTGKTGNLTLLDKNETSVSENSSDARETAILFMQISAPSHGDSAIEIGKLITGSAASSFTLAPVTTFKSIKILSKACALAPEVCGGILALVGVGQQGMVAYNRHIAAGMCSDVSTGSEARNGCSVVRTVNYNATNIAEYCTNIESIP